MKKKIVVTVDIITIHGTEMFFAKIHGQVGNKKTDTKEAAPHATPEWAIQAATDLYIEKIKKWMEQIK